MKGKKQPTITASFILRIGDKQLPLSATVPDRDVTALELIPVIQQLCDSTVSHTIAETQKAGKQISCQAGCGACCAQPVPVTTVEAENLARVIRDMPAARRRAVKARIARSLAAVREAGLDGKLRTLPALTREERRKVAADYFNLKLDCPFLENQSCSIYADRPLECREFLVTSDPKYCASLDGEKIEHVKSTVRLTPALRQLCRDAESESGPGWMLMIYCLESSSGNKSSRPKKHGAQWLKEFMKYVCS